MPTEQELIEQAIASGGQVRGQSGAIDYQHVYYEPNGQPYWKKVGGGKVYIPPASAMSMWDEPKARAWAAQPQNGGFAIDAATPDELQQKNQGSVDANGVYQAAPSLVHGKAPDTGFWGSTPTWSGDTGQYESGFNWEHLLDLVVGGFITAGVASAVMSGTATAADVTAATNGAAQAGVPASSVIPAEAGVGGATGASGGTTAAIAAPGLEAGAEGAAGTYGSAAGIGDLVGSGEAAVEGGSLGAGELAGGAGTLGSAVESAPGVGSTLGRVYKLGQGVAGLGDLLGTAGAAVNGATQSAGNTQLQNALLGVSANNSNIAANNSNISGNSAFETELMKRADQEQAQRKSGLANIYRDSMVENPRVSPFNPKGAPVYSDKYKSALSTLSDQGLSDINAPRQYDSRSLPALKPYTPISTTYNPNAITGAGGTQPSTLQQIGNWVGPGLSTLGILSKYFNW